MFGSTSRLENKNNTPLNCVRIQSHCQETMSFFGDILQKRIRLLKGLIQKNKRVARQTRAESPLAQGKRPGFMGKLDCAALKGRTKISLVSGKCSSPLQGCTAVVVFYPGRCPGLSKFAPPGLDGRLLCRLVFVP